ncbi:MAG: N-acetyltransferase, partial [Pacificimonas sp.]
AGTDLTRLAESRRLCRMISYREPTVDDADALSIVGRKSFVETFGHLYSAKDLQAFLDQVWGDGVCAGEIAAGERTYRIAEEDGRIIGFAKVGKTYMDLPDDGRTKIELAQLYVLKPWQGTGVAAALMDWAMNMAEASGADDCYLSVWSENARAQRFYARYGFEEVGQHIFMVGDHEDDDRIWRKRLRA